MDDARSRAARRPIIIAHGDGTSIWTLTHQDDFARGLVGLAGNRATIGEAVHITTDAALTWDSIAETLTQALCVEAQIVHIASDTLAHAIPEWRAPLLGDWSHSSSTTTRKSKPWCPVSSPPYRSPPVHEQIVDWHLADVQRQVIDLDLDRTIDNVIDRFG